MPKMFANSASEMERSISSEGEVPERYEVIRGIFVVTREVITAGGMVLFVWAENAASMPCITSELVRAFVCVCSERRVWLAKPRVAQERVRTITPTSSSELIVLSTPMASE